jgi:sugar lactone lactonase YvrE
VKSSARGARYAKIDRVEVFDDRVCALGEGPHYDERINRVMWVDILGKRLLWRVLDPTGSERERGEMPVPGHPGAAVPRTNGGLVVCLPEGPALIEPDGSLRMLGTYAQADAAAGHQPPAGVALRSNDAKADPSGRLWLGTMGYDEAPGAGALYRLDPGAPAPVRVLDGITVSNGLGWSPDGRTMYYIDSPTRRVDAFGYQPDTGELGERRAFAALDPEWGFPDGLCVDAEGGVWVACWTGNAVRRFAPDGTLDRVVDVPARNVTSCAFAGAAYDQLIITTAAKNDEDGGPGAGLTYVHRPAGIAGRAVDRFAG